MAAKKSQEKTVRLTPTKETLNQLFAFSGNECAFPGCKHELFDEDKDFIAEVCHIEAAMPGGERFNDKSNNEERRKFDNLMVMCLRHHVKTNNVDEYSTAKLRQMKSEHEARFTEKERQIEVSPKTLDIVFEQQKKITEQILHTVIQTDKKVDQVLSVQEEMMSLLLARLPANDGTKFGNEIDTIMSLRTSGKREAAIEIFEKFREANWEALNETQRFRVLANLGICHLETSHEDVAADYLIEALGHEPDLIKAQSLASLAFTIKKDLPQARVMIEKVLSADSTNAEANQALVYCLAGEGKELEEIIETFSPELRANSEVAYAIGFVARDRGSMHDAIKWMQIALENAEESNTIIKANLAGTILETVDRDTFVLNGMIDPQSKNKVKLAIEYFNEALEESKDSVDPFLRSDWFVHRGVAKKFLGEFPAAYDDILTASTLSDDYRVFRHLAIISMEVANREKMWYALEKMQELATADDDRHDALLYIAEMNIHGGRVDEGLAGLETLAKEDLRENISRYVDNKLVEVYTQTGKFDQAAKLVSEILSGDPNGVKPYLTQAQFFINIGNEDGVLVALDKANTNVSSDTPKADILALAELQGSYRNFENAADLLERLVEPGVYSKITVQLLVAYTNSGQLNKMMDLCTELLEIHGPLEMPTEFLSWGYEELSNLPKAIDVLKEYLSVNPDDQSIQTRLALVYYRQHDKAGLKELLDTIDHIDPTLDITVQFKLIDLFKYLGENVKAKAFLYEVRRNLYEEVGIHDRFVANSIMDDLSEDRVPQTEVTTESVVSLRINDKITHYIMEERVPVFKSRGEIDPNGPLGTALLGKYLGETVEVEGQTFEIVNISDKFGHAVMESLDLLTTKFVPEAKAKKVTLEKKEDGSFDLEAFFAPLTKGKEVDDQINGLYRSQQLPIGAAALLRRISPIRMWANVMSDDYFGVFTTGPLGEIAEADRLIKAGFPLVLDILAITTLSSINALDDLQKLPNEKLVTHSTIEEIYDLIHEQERSNKSGSFTVGISNGQYVKQILTPENVQEQIKHLEGLAEWVKANCKVIPATAGLTLNALDKKELDEKLGKSFVDSILTARQNKGLLYSEEMPLRSFAYTEYKVKGCATFIVLRILKERRLIEPEYYRNKILHLMASNYKFIPVDGEILYDAAVKSKFTTGFPFRTVLKGLSSPLMLQAMDSFEAVKFFYKLYTQKVSVGLEAGNADHIKDLVYAVLSELIQNSDAKKLEENLMRVVDRIFVHSPNHQAEIRKLLNQYFKENYHDQ